MTIDDSKAGPTKYVISGTLLVIGVLLVLTGKGVASWLSSYLPKAMTVRSYGTRFYEFGHSDGFAFQLEVLGTVLLVFSSIYLIHRLVETQSWSQVWSRKMTAIVQRRETEFVLSGLLLSGLVIYTWWVNSPPDLTASNARILWVDVASWNHYDSYMYLVTTLVRMALYPFPALLPTLFLAISFIGMHVIGKKLFQFTLSGFVTASAFAISGNVLLFSPAAEDVSMNLAFVIIAFVAFIYRVSYWFGLACILAFLARPNLGVLFAAAMLVEVATLLARQRGLGLRRQVRAIFTDRFVLSTSLVFVVGLLVWFVFLSYIGENYLTADSSVMTTFNGIKPKEVQGFTISSFSGAYFLHMFWVFPIGFSVAFLLSPLVIRKLDSNLARVAAFCVVATILGVLYHEYRPLFYFNIRYVTYYWPLVIVVGLAVCVKCLPKKLQLLFICALSCTTMGIYHGTMASHDEIDVRAFPYSLYEYRFDLWNWAEGSPVYAQYESKQEWNMLAYLFETKEIGLLPKNLDDMAPGSIVVLRSHLETKKLRVLQNTPGVHIYQYETVR